MAVLRDTPYGNFNFLVDLGTGDTESPEARFNEVILPNGIVDVIEYRGGNEGTSAPRKILGRTNYDNVILKRGLIGSLDLYEWWDEARRGNMSVYRDVTIQLLNEERSESVMVWRLFNAWPTGYHCSSLDAQGGDVVIEILELAYERFEMR